MYYARNQNKGNPSGQTTVTPNHNERLGVTGIIGNMARSNLGFPFAKALIRK